MWVSTALTHIVISHIVFEITETIWVNSQISNNSIAFKRQYFKFNIINQHLASVKQTSIQLQHRYS